ncbi:MAG TPA: hypothetical protein VGN31_09105, partial [Paraburkholderia sp.]
MKHLFSVLLVASSIAAGVTASAQVASDATLQAPQPGPIGTPLEASMKRGGSSALDLRELPSANVRKHEPSAHANFWLTPIELPGSMPASQVDATAPLATASAPAPSASFAGLDFANWGTSH